MMHCWFSLSHVYVEHRVRPPPVPFWVRDNHILSELYQVTSGGSGVRHPPLCETFSPACAACRRTGADSTSGHQTLQLVDWSQELLSCLKAPWCRGLPDQDDPRSQRGSLGIEVGTYGPYGFYSRGCTPLLNVHFPVSRFHSRE